MGAATAHALMPKALETPEIFDEHAALTLHLLSYMVVCGFNDSEGLLRHLTKDVE